MGEYGAGGALSAGSRQYIWLPTPAGPMPVATVQNNSAVQSVMADHLNTPCRVMHADGTLLWQWPFSAFGETPPTIAQRRFAAVAPVEGEFEFNLRYPGQYFDKESELHYNGFRTYDPKTGRYTQPDPIGLAGGWNRFNYVGSNALAFSDPNGLAAQAVAPVAMALPAVALGYAISPGFRSLVNSTAKQCFGAIERMFTEAADPDNPKIHEGQQGKHIPGHNNFRPGSSELTDSDPQELLDQAAGRGQQVGDTPAGQSGSKERYDFGKNIGNYVDSVTGEKSPTSVGIIHHGSNGSHIVPARPRQ